MTRMGIRHHLGQGVPEDYAEAQRLFEQAAGLGDPEAMFWLGRMHLLGHGPSAASPDADRDAARWFFEAARRNHAEAQYYLGLLFMAGTGVQRDEVQALRWIRRSAASGLQAAREFLKGTRDERPARATGRKTGEARAARVSAPGTPGAKPAAGQK